MTQDLTLERNMEDNKNMARILYILHALALVFSLGLLSIIPLIVNYIKRDDAQGTFVYSHHSWMIRSFWWYAFWMFVAAVFFIALGWVFGLGGVIAWIIGVLAWIWKAYRLIKGFFDLEKNRAMAA